MEWAEVQQYIRAGEGDRVEFKSTAATEGLDRAVAALSNCEGGLVVLGVDDAGAVVGLPDDPEALQESLTSRLRGSFLPPVSARLGRQQVGGLWVHWVEIRRNRGPVPTTVRGRVFIRRGRASVEPSPSELQELFNRFGFVLTEEQVVPGTGEGDLDATVFARFLQRQGLDTMSAPQPAVAADYRNRGALADDDGALRPTLFGLLCFGRQPQSFAPTRNACIAMAAYAGNDRADDVILRGEALGRADEQVDRAMGWMQALGTREEYVGARRIDRPPVALAALREALVNAVAHRDYAITGSRTLLEVFSDRVEVTSPGELPNHLTPAAVLAGGVPRSRNEAVAHALLVLGYMEARGRGLPIVRREMRAFNSTEPVLESNREARYVRLTLRR